MVRSNHVLAFLDSGISHSLILGRSSVLHYILIFMDTSWETNTSSRVVVTYVRRIDCINSLEVSVYNDISESGLLADRVMIFSIFITLIVIMISLTMFVEFGCSQN